MKTCILISTFEKYRRMAVWTAHCIDREWRDHPPVFYAGLDADGEGSLGFQGDSSDWMSVNLDGVTRLKKRGYTHAYLILDDHPPVGRCNEKYLNEELPRLASELDAAYIGLLGYGQHREREGEILGKEFSLLEKSALDYRWKFSLHPGLWKLDSLEDILRARMDLYHGRERSPWSFERHRDGLEFSRMFRSYRVHGASSAVGGLLSKLGIAAEACRRFAADCALFVAKITGGKAARDAAEIRRMWLYGHYQGPYPIFWSGCMRQGRVNRDFEKWVSRYGKLELESSWNEVKTDCFLE
jgi:hypothetical protein